jgi:nitrite reductase (NADH) large subunit
MSSTAVDGLRRIVVVGNGMVGHRFVEAAIDRGLNDRAQLVVVGEETRPAYDRVALSSYFDDVAIDDLSLVEPGSYERAGVTLLLGERIVRIDRVDRLATTDRGRSLPYHELILATGSYPFVPPIDGADASGVFVYRTIDDLERLRAHVTHERCRVGAVVGGGLLGLEAANALRKLGLTTHVVEAAPKLMAVQLDDGGAAALRRRVESLGVHVHTAMVLTRIAADDEGHVRRLEFADGIALEVDVLVIAAGIRPRDELARGCGLEIGVRGGVVIDDRCRTSDPSIHAIGECASHRDRVHGLVAPGYRMAEALADALVGADTVFEAAVPATKLKLLGVDVAACGDSHGDTEHSHAIVWSDPVAGVYKKLVLSPDSRRLVGTVLVGDASVHPTLVTILNGDLPLPDDPASLIAPNGSAPTIGTASLGANATVCSCLNVSKGRIVGALAEGEATDVRGLKACTKAGTGCGSCVPVLDEIVRDEMTRAGKVVDDHLCEHLPFNRQQVFDLVRLHRYSSFRELVQAHGQGRGCEICKPAVASMLASMSNGYILDGEQASLQDTNDHFLANMQRDGTYSVVPRIPGGEITPTSLIAIGEIARDFDLYTKITGGQRIDLFGARVDQLPAIWQRLIDAGFESGHAYGKALRTVKSCVGSTWCRYGMHDSVALAIELELRYRGLRAPHKLKSAVSGCARECAEAQSKDFGIIATEKGWNLYVCGNGGMRPQHAVLFAEDLDTVTLIRYLDRFLMFYIRTADRLERTATWFRRLDGGVEYLRRVVIGDELGICAELEADMARHVASYECEWKATLDDPRRVARFRSFVNSDSLDDSIVHVRERGQRRPAAVGSPGNLTHSEPLR